MGSQGDQAGLMDRNRRMSYQRNKKGQIHVPVFQHGTR